MISELANKIAEEIVGAQPLDASAVLPPPCAPGKKYSSKEFVL